MRREPRDAELVRRTLDGDGQAFDRLVRRYSRRALAVAWEYTESRDEAEDVVQEAYFRALRKLESYDSERPFPPWFFTILRNVARNVAEARGRWRFVPVPEELPAGGTDPATDAEHRGAIERIDEALESLSPMQRACFRLCEGEGFRSTEVGDMLGVSEATVRVHVHRARKALAALLGTSREGATS